MRSIFGECSGNMRSTPTPKDCLRTVNVSRAPWPWRLITTPSKTWTRRRVPSMTWKWTFTRSPGAKLGNAAQLGALDRFDDAAHNGEDARSVAAKAASSDCAVVMVAKRPRTRRARR